jgi:hypothetical protein
LIPPHLRYASTCSHLVSLGVGISATVRCTLSGRLNEPGRLGMSFLLPESCVPFLNDQPSGDDGGERSFRKNAVFFIKALFGFDALPGSFVCDLVQLPIHCRFFCLVLICSFGILLFICHNVLAVRLVNDGRRKNDRSCWLRELLAESELLRDRTCCALDYICNLLGMRHIAAMAGACDFDCVAPGPFGIPTLQVRVDGSIAS